MISMEVITGFLTITLPILVSVWLGNRQTQRIIQNTNIQTQRVIREIIENTAAQTQRIIENANAQTQRIIENTNAQVMKLLNEIKQLQKDMLLCLRKLDFGFKANALMHGWRRVDGISPEEAAKLPEPKIYDEQLKICYYKAS